MDRLSRVLTDAVSPWVAVVGRSVIRSLRASGLVVLKTLLPFPTEGLSELCAWIDSTRRLKESGFDEVEVDLSHDQVKRLRSHLPPLEMFKNWGQSTARVVSVWWRVLPPQRRRQIHVLFTSANLFRRLAPSALMGAFKALSSIMKRFQIDITPFWEDYVDLASLRDYQPDKRIEDFADDVRE